MGSESRGRRARNRRRRVVALWLALACAGGCATARRKGDDAFDKGLYVEAADFYAQAVRDDPKDEEAAAKRTDARHRALAKELAEAQGLRAGGHQAAARAKLAAFFGLRRRWGTAEVPAELGPRLGAEVQVAAGEIEARVRPLLEAALPLEAERALAEEKGVLGQPELRELGVRLRGDTRALGGKRCHELLAAASAGAPYWQWLLGVYCEHFGQEAPPAALPLQRAAADVRMEVAGVGAHAAVTAAAKLARAFIDTPWHAPEVSAVAAVEVRGRYAMTVQHQPVTLQVPWTQQVPYQTTEMRRVPHQVSYLATESYTVSVPHTSYQSYSYSCGYGTHSRSCTGSRSVTTYRTDFRHRTVTRWRTEYSTVYDTVTRYRSVPRTFSYEAEAYRASFALSARLTMDLLPGEQPLIVALDGGEVREGHSHDVTFAPAGVEPTRPDFPSADQWLLAHVGAQADRLHQRLLRHWHDRFCGGAEMTVEEAARCLYGGQVVAAAPAALATPLGRDAAAASTLAVESRAP